MADDLQDDFGMTADEAVSARLRNMNRRINEYRREARETYALVSPFRQKLYINARLKGEPPELAIERARGNLRKKKR